MAEAQTLGNEAGRPHGIAGKQAVEIDAGRQRPPLGGGRRRSHQLDEHPVRFLRVATGASNRVPSAPSPLSAPVKPNNSSQGSPQMPIQAMQVEQRQAQPRSRRQRRRSRQRRCSSTPARHRQQQRYAEQADQHPPGEADEQAFVQVQQEVQRRRRRQHPATGRVEVQPAVQARIADAEGGMAGSGQQQGRIADVDAFSPARSSRRSSAGPPPACAGARSSRGRRGQGSRRH